ncbi:MAG: TIGR02757 family protein [Paludibacter sp. 47-17]|nr:MAG: TIGR02757 family protein [Paludibacter sp. 47-17]
MKETDSVLFELLEDQYRRYNVPSYIDDDPIQVPHLFGRKEDIEIASFLTASIAWGQRKTIIKHALELMSLMDYQPYEFIRSAGMHDLALFDRFVHRTFNGADCRFFVESLRHMYEYYGGLEAVFTKGFQRDSSIYSALSYFREVFLTTSHEHRSEKHVSSVQTGSAAKRLNMMLRWLVRRDATGVDFGIWTGIPMSGLMIPLDVHVGKVARSLGLLTRRQHDWKAVVEITEKLREFDPEDPGKYDYALFGMGVNRETNFASG